VSALAIASVRFFSALHALLAARASSDTDTTRDTRAERLVAQLPADALLDFRWARDCGLSEDGAAVLARALEAFDAAVAGGADADGQGAAMRQAVVGLSPDDAGVAAAFAAAARDRLASGGDAQTAERS
jgi:hypothetical protein